MKQNCVIVLVGILAYSGIVGVVNSQCVTNQTVAVPIEKYAAFIVPDSGAALTLTITSAPPRKLVFSQIIPADTSDLALWQPSSHTGPGPHVYKSGPVLSSREWLRISGILDGGGGHGGEGHGGGGSTGSEVFDVDVPAVDIAMAGVDEDKEETPGGYVGVGTNCLQKVTINKVKSISRFTTGKVMLTVTNGARIRLWEEATRIHEIVTFPKEYTTPSGLPKDIWVEGIAASATNRDVELKASYTTPTENKTTEDKVKITVLKVDLEGTTYPYSSMHVDNLVGVWTQRNFGVKVRFTPDIPSLPSDYIVWHASSVTPPANNSREFSFIRNMLGMETLTVEFPQLGISKKVIIDYPDVGAYSEGELFFIHPFIAAGAGYYGLAAQNYAETLEAGGMDYSHANAIQHSYWASLMASDPSIGPTYSIWVTTAHEHMNFDDGGLAHDTVMDLHNNYVGSTVIHTDPSGMLQVGLIQVDLAAKLAAGDLWIINDADQMVIKSNGIKIFP